MKIDFRRNLPHMYREDAIYSITYRLAGSIPRNLIKEYLVSKKRLLNENRPLEAKSLFYDELDQYLDHEKNGPMFLESSEAKKIVASSILFFEGKCFQVICYCIMSNHVHLIINTLHFPNKPLGDFLGSIKKYSAKHINNHLGCKGTFWQSESYDHVIRSRNELAETISYVINNPVKAGCCDDWKSWPGTYVDERYLEI